MAINTHLKQWGGKKVVEFVPGKTKLAENKAYRVWFDAYGNETDYGELEISSFANVWQAFLDAPGVERVTALVTGPWGDMPEDNKEVTEALVKSAKRLPNLQALFVGDLVMEESEISWIQQSNMGPILKAYPMLVEFGVRGGTGLRFQRAAGKALRKLVVETGGLNRAATRDIVAADFPALEHLELWLGEETYGRTTTVKDLEPLLKGKVFRKLKYLGLRNADIADELAVALAKSPILKRIEVLDLSLGTLSDDGAQALAASKDAAKLQRLDIHHHFVSKQAVAAMQKAGIKVDARQRMKPYDWDEDGRYVSVGE